FVFLFFQSIILLTGNYNFFNLLTMLLCLSLFDDAALHNIIPLKKSLTINPPAKLLIFAGTIFTVVIVFVSGTQFYLKFVGPVAAPVQWINNIISPLQLVNTYGPFAVMTTERREIIIEGSEDSVDWQEYAFKYKPGDIYRAPRWIVPHDPRLDWQMWFAALNTPDQSPWFSRLLQRLLENSPDVVGLLDYNPFPFKPPLYIRAQFYRYQFTDREERKKTGAWWKRELLGEYYPAVYLRRNP
ncbi:MAG TPA: lipase maturation factor family protein, partial [Gammaproteobacteria bacterium]|nr:lipase maturation factor family protein [Gammaproteobacteria bacterium]